MSVCVFVLRVCGKIYIYMYTQIHVYVCVNMNVCIPSEPRTIFVVGSGSRAHKTPLGDLEGTNKKECFGLTRCLYIYIHTPPVDKCWAQMKPSARSWNIPAFTATLSASQVAS